MGMYTEIYINCDLREGTPDEVINTLKAMCECDWESPYLKDTPSRWSMLFNNGSYHTPLTRCGNLTYDKIGKHYSLIAKGDIKNYENEIEQFFEWIKPYAEQEFIGYILFEESREPTLIYSRDEDYSDDTHSMYGH